MKEENPLYVLPENVEMRWINAENISGAKGSGGKANYGRKGNPHYGHIKAGEQVVLADYHGGSGIIRHIWTTTRVRSPKMLRGLRMDFYWDGESKPAISVPWGDFFGAGLGCMVPFENALFNSPEGRNFNSFIPMPFRTGFRITVTNETDTNSMSFWFQVDFTINDPAPERSLYLHAYYHRERRTHLRRDNEFLCPVKGAGRYIGANFGVIANTDLYFKAWWGEGEVKIYIDGDTQYPTLCGTGTEDYPLTSWGFGRFSNLYSGCHLADFEKDKFCFHRYHVQDPIYFRKEIRATIQQIGCMDSVNHKEMFYSGNKYLRAGNETCPLDLSPKSDLNAVIYFERSDDWSSCAYFYLDKAANELPPLEPVETRIEGL